MERRIQKGEEKRKAITKVRKVSEKAKVLEKQRFLGREVILLIHITLEVAIREFVTNVGR